MRSPIRRRSSTFFNVFASASLAVIAAGCNAGSTVSSSTASSSGMIYAQTNSASGNAIMRYSRSTTGALSFDDTTSTGANGIGAVNVINGVASVDPLFSSNSVVLSTDHSRLYTVNAGSNSITAFSVAGDGTLHLVGAYATGGTTPTSLALYGNLLYVTHAKANAANKQIMGFTVNSDGSLAAISGATYATTAVTNIGQAAFSPSGGYLEVSELMTNKIDIFPVQTNGTLGTVVANTSAAPGPFGAAWLDATHVLVSEVHTPADVNAGSVSSYSVSGSGTLTTISSAISNGQNASCWLRISPNGRYVFSANTSSGNVSVYGIDGNAALSLVSGTQASRPSQGATDFLGHPASGAADGVVSADGKYYYEEYTGLGVIGAYTINSDGTLTAVTNGDGTGLPMVGAEGIAGY